MEVEAIHRAARRVVQPLGATDEPSEGAPTRAAAPPASRTAGSHAPSGTGTSPDAWPDVASLRSPLSVGRGRGPLTSPTRTAGETSVHDVPRRLLTPRLLQDRGLVLGLVVAVVRDDPQDRMPAARPGRRARAGRHQPRNRCLSGAIAPRAAPTDWRRCGRTSAAGDRPPRRARPARHATQGTAQTDQPCRRRFGYNPGRHLRDRLRDRRGHRALRI
jgi:hypothetical protein